MADAQRRRSVGGRVVLALAVLALAILDSASGDDSGGTTTPAEKPAAITATRPPAGGEMLANGVLIVNFDNPPGGVAVNGNAATVADKTATWSATGLSPGPTVLNITWDHGGPATLTLTVVAPDTDPPRLVSASVRDGDDNVDPEPLNREGIVLEFNEPVMGPLEVYLLDAETDFGWIPSAEGNRVMLEPVAGEELAGGTHYAIIGTVQDNVKNEAQIRLTFTTRAVTTTAPVATEPPSNTQTYDVLSVVTHSDTTGVGNEADASWTVIFGCDDGRCDAEVRNGGPRGTSPPFVVLYRPDTEDFAFAETATRTDDRCPSSDLIWEIVPGDWDGQGPVAFTYTLETVLHCQNADIRVNWEGQGIRR